MKRGDICLVSIPGYYSKSGLSLIIQSDLFINHESTIILLITSHIVDAPLFRININPTIENGLLLPSQIMIDKVYTLPKDKIKNKLGELKNSTMMSVDRLLMLFFGIA